MLTEFLPKGQREETQPVMTVVTGAVVFGASEDCGGKECVCVIK